MRSFHAHKYYDIIHMDASSHCRRSSHRRCNFTGTYQYITHKLRIDTRTRSASFWPGWARLINCKRKTKHTRIALHWLFASPASIKSCIGTCSGFAYAAYKSVYRVCEIILIARFLAGTAQSGWLAGFWTCLDLLSPKRLSMHFWYLLCEFNEFTENRYLPITAYKNYKLIVKYDKFGEKM